MESGNRKDPTGQFIPAHHITDLLVTHNGRTVLQADFGPSVSRDPLLAFRFQGGQAGDHIRVEWRDNRGASGAGEAAILG
jgi:sulfur-oxidizing protein SoxZ